MFRLCRTILILLVAVSALMNSGCLNLEAFNATTIHGPCCEHMTADCRTARVGCCDEGAPAEGTTSLVSVRADYAPQLQSVHPGPVNPHLSDPLQGVSGAVAAFLDTGQLAARTPLRI